MTNLDGIHDSRDLGNSYSGDHTSGTDRTRADTNLDSIYTGINQGPGPVSRGDISAHKLALGISGLDGCNRLQNICGMAMSGIKDQHIHASLYKGCGTIIPITTHTNGGTNTQTPESVFTGIGVFTNFFNILDGQKPFEIILIIHHQQLFDSVLVQQPFGLHLTNPHRNSDQVFAGHDLLHLARHISHETDISIGYDTNQMAFLDNGQPRNTVFGHKLENTSNFILGMNNNGVHDHPTF